jgi:serine/threonine-protein kinase
MEEGREPLAVDQTVRLTGALPHRIGRYEILGELGRGAMGVVYKGKDPLIDRMVAVKVIRFDQLYEEGEISPFKERFFQEAKAAGKLSHPQIVTIFDVGEDRGTSYIAMEYVEGKPLSQHISPEPLLPMEEVLRIVADVAMALDYASHHGIVHRDIKPANIMCTIEGQVKVMDFGIAKLSSSNLTQTGTTMGTPSYMSPEQIQGGEVDGRSDLFSLGVVLYELLTGERPFKGDNMATLMFHITTMPIPPLKDIASGIPDSCAAIIERLLAKDREARYQSGKDLADDLARCLRQ